MKDPAKGKDSVSAEDSCELCAIGIACIILGGP